jgi:hypothetical protein
MIGKGLWSTSDGGVSIRIGGSSGASEPIIGLAGYRDGKGLSPTATTALGRGLTAFATAVDERIRELEAETIRLSAQLEAARAVAPDR